MKQKAVIFDIDGVLAKIGKNEDGSPKRGYRDYDKVDSDEVIEEVCRLLKSYTAIKDEYRIFIITGRKELCRDETARFLIKHTINQGYRDFYKNIAEWSSEALHACLVIRGWQLFMRPDDDHRPAVKLKEEIYEKHIKDNYDVIMAFDDDPKVCEMYKSKGILTLQVMTREDNNNK